MKVNEFYIGDIEDKLHTCVRKKRERAVYKDGSFYYKIWVPEWTKSEVVKVALDCGFYDDFICPVMAGTIYDDTGQRGYILKEGVEIVQHGIKDWRGLVEHTTKKQRLDFLSRVIENSLRVHGTFLDFFPSNLVLFENKISFIDLDSFGSFGFVFDGKKEWYEKFSLDAWWKPLETSRRDLNLSLRGYLKECLDIEYDGVIDSKDDFCTISDILSKN